MLLKGFQKGREKTGGRTKGTPNKRRVIKVADYLITKGLTPVEEILKLMPFLEPKEQMKAWLDLLSYCQTKPREDAPDNEMDGEELLQKFDQVSDEVLLKLVSSEKP